MRTNPVRTARPKLDGRGGKRERSSSLHASAAPAANLTHSCYRLLRDTPPRNRFVIWFSQYCSLLCMSRSRKFLCRTTMHRCLAIQEIVELIVSFAEDAHVSSKGSQHPSIAILQTCRSFYNPGCNSRWRELTQIEPLLNLFDPNPQARSGSEGRPTPLEVRLLRFLLHHSY